MVHIVHILVIQCGFVTVRVSLKCSRFNHAFSVYQLVLLGLLFCLDGVILCLPHNVIGFAYDGLTSFGQRFLDIVWHVLSQDWEVKLFAAFAVERNSSDFALLFTLFGLVAIVLWSTRSKFDDRVAFIELVLEIAQIIAQLWFLLAR